LITWQWAPDRRPAHQAGQLLNLMRRAAPFLAAIATQRTESRPTTPNNKKSRRKRRLFREYGRGSSDQALFGECDTHQPFALTALPGNSWHGP
jgi:hypothetical protein